MNGRCEEASTPGLTLKCPNCGASASLPLGMSCSDHRPVLVPEETPWWLIDRSTSSRNVVDEGGRSGKTECSCGAPATTRVSVQWSDCARIYPYCEDCAEAIVDTIEGAEVLP